MSDDPSASDLTDTATDPGAPLPAVAGGPFPEYEIAQLAKRARKANGPLMSILQKLGGTVEAQMGLLPDGIRKQVDGLTLATLERALGVAALGRHAPDMGPAAAPIAAAISGAAGGAGGLLTSVAELPVTITLILGTIRAVAEAEGFDPDDPAIKAEILRCFASGTPLGGDDGVNTAFIGARITVTGTALNKLVATLAPKIAATMGQKLAAQAVPVLGALSGAALNAAFLRHYRELARIRFRLLRLGQEHGAERVVARFSEAASVKPLLGSG
ncbi:EcsC family protein [Gemmobacter serpentinus]|uniref:EcsC family protein n=1 Tax=Gemmobacter serpentinus TaxID=2652247 RepID=UPI00124C3323|nr:EcsC family protein [Gemmobacter serpentinus]